MKDQSLCMVRFFCWDFLSGMFVIYNGAQFNDSVYLYLCKHLERDSAGVDFYVRGLY